MQPVTLEELRKVIAVSDLPDEQLQWILDRAEFREYEDGALIMKTGMTIDEMWFVTEGKGDFYMDVNGKLVYYFTFENDKQTGGVGGLLPYSRMKKVPGNNYAVGKVRIVLLHKKYFPELEQMNPDLIQRLIGYMTERARAFATTQLQHEKVNALGKLAAGIAHELNNPAAAINRISSELSKRVKSNYDLTEKLILHKVNPAHIHNISVLVQLKEKEDLSKKKLTSMQRLDKEDQMIDWLEEKGFGDIKMVAETFCDAGFSTDDLEAIFNITGKESFGYLLGWWENLLISRRVLKDLEEASSRISHLVGAIKSHVHMDRTNDMQPTNINKDLDNTITLLGYKLREKKISVNKMFTDNIPDVQAYVGELNQVWTNLIDNAIYALPQGGELTIETCSEPKNVIVKIIDNGSGIPQDIQSRIFDPFFTTKKVGEGTGIGLDIVNRIVKRHNGEIKLNSEPGRTEFKVCIPLHPVTTAAATATATS